jgi:hypothetical protein
MSDIRNWRWEKSTERISPAGKDFGQAARDICDKSLNEAKEQLHPLLRNVDMERLEQRSEFLQAFKNALERRIARTLAAWQPSVQAVFKFDEIPMESLESWDGSIHLLVKIPRLSNTVKVLGKTLDKVLVKRLKQLGLPRFEQRQSVLDVQQVTPNELRHGIGYGAMFCAVYTVPVKVWSQDKAIR